MSMDLLMDSYFIDFKNMRIVKSLLRNKHTQQTQISKNSQKYY